MGNPAKGWTPERRQRQSEAIQRWKPWNKSTGPRSPKSKAAVARNAYRGGEGQKLKLAVKKLNAALREQQTAMKEFNG